MKKTGIINADISRVLSYMGHTDKIAVGDCGLPIPEETERVDLALRLGTPRFMEVLEAVLDDMVIEKVVLAEEIKENNPALLAEIQNLLKERELQVPVEFISHAQLKEETKSCRAVIRSGENTPYANIILQSACIFG
ncbi:MAG: D-ribose pyranase [Lachnospiraceae bacterium]|nr:D-ribose pyranase [Lachnospiraceae bacterium]MDY3729444.1 D-ribose pyranase [Candidatus Choladocola sp.]